MAHPWLLLLDFDHTVIDVNSDTYVIKEASKTVAEAQNELMKSMQWTDLMAETMRLLHAGGVTKEAILQVLSNVPMPAETIAALKEAHACGATIIIISDANSVFIQEILKAHGLFDIVERIITNPAVWSEVGAGEGKDGVGGEMLAVTRLHVPSNPHGCERCVKTPNMCKGKIVADLIKLHTPTTIVYGGDGGNDFCAACSLRPDDFVLPRGGYTLAKKLAQDQTKGSNLVTATQRLWNDYEEFGNTIAELSKQQQQNKL